MKTLIKCLKTTFFSCCFIELKLMTMVVEMVQNSTFIIHIHNLFIHIQHLFIHIQHLFIGIQHLFIHIQHLFIHIQHSFIHIQHLFIHIQHLCVCSISIYLSSTFMLIKLHLHSTIILIQNVTFIFYS